jgi:hypothetical protein
MVNGQYADGVEFFPGISAGVNRAPGSAGGGPETSAGPEVGRPVVSVPGASSQVPASMPVVTVTAGDTSGMSTDRPVNPSAFQGDAGPQMDTGAGQGNANPYRHPASGG